MVPYEVCLAIFALGMATSLLLTFYIVRQYLKNKDKDPFEGE